MKNIQQTEDRLALCWVGLLFVIKSLSFWCRNSQTRHHREAFWCISRFWLGTISFRGTDL